ncbi:hypothetical protein [Paenibacillus sp. S29]|uniref:hypothetical protein n=1 Tax=Paenibacillus sp. S29 TaxID=3394611 RepID=UPI0039BFB6D7
MSDFELRHNINGFFNNQRLNASGTISLHDSGNFSANLAFEDLPTKFTPYLLGFSLISISCLANAREDKAKNIISLSDGRFNGLRSYTIEDSQKNVLGSIMTVVTVNKQKNTSELFLVGNYDGPTNFNSCSNYSVEMNQNISGKISGSYSQTIRTLDDDIYTIRAYAEYGFTNNILLTEPQIFSCEYSDQNFNNINATLKGSARTASLVNNK